MSTDKPSPVERYPAFEHAERRDAPLAQQVGRGAGRSTVHSMTPEITADGKGCTVSVTMDFLDEPVAVGLARMDAALGAVFSMLKRQERGWEPTDEEVAHELVALGYGRTFGDEEVAAIMREYDAAAAEVAP